MSLWFTRVMQALNPDGEGEEYRQGGAEACRSSKVELRGNATLMSHDGDKTVSIWNYPRI